MHVNILGLDPTTNNAASITFPNTKQSPTIFSLACSYFSLININNGNATRHKSPCKYVQYYTVYK